MGRVTDLAAYRVRRGYLAHSRAERIVLWTTPDGRAMCWNSLDHGFGLNAGCTDITPKESQS